VTGEVLRVAMNGVTGRMGSRQHLVRSLLALRAEGGVELPGGRRVQVEPVLVGRDAGKLGALARRHDVAAWSTSLDDVLADPSVRVYFDAQVTHARPAALRRALEAGKHVYTEKPVAGSLAGALELARLAAGAGVCHGVVADKLYLPGLRKLKLLADSGFFGRILSVRGEFGYWVFEGRWQPAQRPSWNYRAEDGGGIVTDMFPHWCYVLDRLVAPVRSVYASAATHIPVRYDEAGQRYDATADDAAYAIFELEGGVVAQVNSSWAVRVHRDELVEFQVDGTDGSAVAGLRRCDIQHRATTPRPVWDPDAPQSLRFRDGWQPVPDNGEFANAFKVQWAEFLSDVLAGRSHAHDLLAGARGVQLAELALRSSAEGRRLEVPELTS
jgi:predicted dehydrogenase